MRDLRDWTGEIRKLSLVGEAPVRQKDGVWEVVDRKATWKIVAPAIFDEHLERLRNVAVEVLTERDPQFDLEADERYAAAIHKKVLKHSRQIRQGLAETLALIGSDPKALTSSNVDQATGAVVLAVRGILAGADWLRWASLGDCLPTLAEAAPTEFLDAVDTALQKTPALFNSIFAEESSGFMGRNYMTGLLWGLEALAWTPDYLGRTTLVLGGLAKLDPGGRWANRPANSLCDIFLPWHPQTLASFEAQKASVAALIREQPDVGWKLLLALLPNTTRTTSGTYKPRWRDWVTEDWTPKVTNQQYRDATEAYAGMAFNLAKGELGRMAEIIKRLPNLPKMTFELVIEHLASDEILHLDEASRRVLWDPLTSIIDQHRKYAEADWAMPEEVVGRISAVAERLAPTAPELLSRRLFGRREWDLYRLKENHESERQRIDGLRQEAVREVLKAGGLARVKSFAKDVENPRLVGLALGKVGSDDLDSEILPAMLGEADRPLREFAQGFVFGRFLSREWAWLDDLLSKPWPAVRKAEVLALLPFEKAVWERAARCLGKDEGLYWREVNPFAAGDRPELLEAVQKLLTHGRPFAALECLGRLHFNKMNLPTATVARALEDALTSTEPKGSLEFSNVEELLGWLQQQPDIDPAQVATLEWNYLPGLGHGRQAAPKLLEQRLATIPAFFCEVVRAVFRPEHERGKKREPTEHERNVASNAYHLLQDWRTVPGLDTEGKFDATPFDAWLAEVKKISAASGHLSTTLNIVGQVLPFSPPDPDGLWLHRAVAQALEAQDAERMRDGFTTKLFNMRGVHGFTEGKAEREIAAGFRKKAEDLDKSGFPRVAGALRGLAETYERLAEREGKRDPEKD